MSTKCILDAEEIKDLPDDSFIFANYNNTLRQIRRNDILKYCAEILKVQNNLTTIDTGMVLDAYQGYVLSQKISNLEQSTKTKIEEAITINKQYTDEVLKGEIVEALNSSY